jgi:hypothetical protein
LSTTNPTWTGPGSNSGLRGGMPATNRLSHGTAVLEIMKVRKISVFCEFLNSPLFL